MRNYRASGRVSIATAISLLVAQPAVSAPGGGGSGGGSMPSESTPAYDPAAEYQKGAAAYQAQDFKAAATAFKHVISVVPRHAPAQYLLGSSYLQMADFKKAKRPLELAVKYDPEMIDGLRDLGVTYAKLGEVAGATSKRDALIQMKTGCADPCATVARLDEAVRAVDAALAGTPLGLAPQQRFGTYASVDAVYVSSVSLINEGRYQAAITELESALWTTGPHPDLLTYLGFANRKLKRYDAARERYEEALAVAPNHRGALEYYGELKLELNDVKGARQHLARLDALCSFGCQQADELRRWIREADRSAS